MDQEVSEKAGAILHGTHDGDDLDPMHLWLVQEAVNGHLNEKGMAAFREVYAQVASGKYKKPWFCGIEHLTLDHEGYVYWKDIRVEHYSSPYGPEAKRAVEELGRRCRILESRGIKPTCRTAIWEWKDEIMCI